MKYIYYWILHFFYFVLFFFYNVLFVTTSSVLCGYTKAMLLVIILPLTF